MNSFTRAIVALGLIIVAIASFMKDEGWAAAKIVGSKALNASATGAGWLAAKLEAAAKSVNDKRVLSA